MNDHIVYLTKLIHSNALTSLLTIFHWFIANNMAVARFSSIDSIKVLMWLELNYNLG